ncbi:hypothetical protein ACDA63_19025 [Uliginosibacterium sp. sgz301328]|uniref:hypothetical protein n=1 Tax=Uliginosibacterium sp. sgz301328 TaxID=3243764 RepID=UPI00359DA85F
MPGGMDGISSSPRKVYSPRRAAARAEVFDPPLFAALCSANFMQAVQRPARYQQLLAPMSLASDERIAFLLGVAEPNSFYRAFQDLTGQTPDSARHAMRVN